MPRDNHDLADKEHASPALHSIAEYDACVPATAPTADHVQGLI